MNIFLTIPSFYPAVIYGGPIFSTYYTCEELSKLTNIKLNVCTTNANMTSRLDIETNKWIKTNDNFRVKYYNETIIGYLSISLILNIWKVIKENDISHIQSLFNTPTPFVLLYSRLFRKQIILSPRGQLGIWCLENGSKLKKIWLKLFIEPHLKYITWHATAQQEKNEILSVFKNAKVAIIPNGIKYKQFQKFNNFSKKEYLNKFINKAIEPNKIIVSMGRLQKKKGFDILIDSFFEILKLFPNSILLIAGADEGEESNLKKQIKNLNLEDNAFLIGAIGGQDKIDFLANADLFCLPSHNENFGNVYIESLATGTPIVASKMTPWSEVEEFNCGKWVENNVKQTADAMCSILNEDRQTMRINSKKLAIKYDWENIAIKFKDLFEELLEKK